MQLKYKAAIDYVLYLLYDILLKFSLCRHLSKIKLVQVESVIRLIGSFLGFDMPWKIYNSVHGVGF